MKLWRVMRKCLAILFFSLLIFIGSESCKKNDSNPIIYDHRSSFIGDFKFTVCNTYWFLTPDSILHINDTILTNGSISLYRDDQLLIKYDSGDFTGIWRSDTIGCNGWMICYIEDSLINRPPNIGNSFFMGYVNSWVSPVLHKDSTMDIPCIPYPVNGSEHFSFGGYFINTDSLYLFYSDGGLGAGSYRHIYGRRH